MSNAINVQIVGTANTSGMTGPIAGLRAEVDRLNASLARMVSLQNGPDPKGYQRMTKAAAQTQALMRDGAASTGMWEVQQVRLNKASDDYTNALDKQALSFKKMASMRKVAAAAYREQLAMQDMQLMKGPDSTRHGKMDATAYIPTEVHKDMDTMRQRLGFLSAELQSGGRQMVNWGKNTQWAGRQLMVGFTMPLMAAGAAAGVMAYQIDKELTRITKVYDTTYNRASESIEEVKRAEQELLEVRRQATQTAIDSAKRFGAAGKDTLEVQAELAATGLAAEKLQESTTQVTRIATLGEIDHAVATKSLIAMQQTLGATTKETADAFNFMNSVENATSLATADFAAAIPRALGPMKEMSRDGASAQEVLENLTVLMVAMKERGIEAGEGANAIKALMARIYRPSKQVVSEWEAMGLGDPSQFAKQGKDIMEILQMVAEKVNGLKGNQRTQALAGLFGTYQVGRMNAMLKGLGSINEAGSQTARVFDVMGQSAEDWNKTAEAELATQAESIAGKWDRALQTMKLQLSTLGEPFVEMATTVLNGLSGIIGWFNKLPGFVKKGIGALLGLAAIAGPIIMLVGLFANLAGQAIGFGGSLLKLATGFGLLTKESKINALAAEMTSAGFVTMGNSAALTGQKIDVLTQSINRAIEVQNNLGKQQAKASGGTFISTPTVSTRPHTKAEIDDMTKRGYEHMAANGQLAADGSVAMEKSSKKIKAHMAGANAATAAMTAGLLASTLSSNKLVNDIGQYLMLASMVVPSIVLLVSNWKLIGTKIWAATKALGAFATGQVASGKLAMSLGGKVGLIGIAVTAVAFGIYKWNKHMADVRKEASRVAVSVNGIAKAWAEGAGRAKKSWGELKVAQAGAVGDKGFQKLYGQYQNDPDLKKKVEDVKTVGKDDEEATFELAKQHFMELQVMYGLSSDAAALHVRALMAAANQSLVSQNYIVQQLQSSIGTMKNSDLHLYVKNQADALSALKPETKEFTDAAKDVVDAFATSFNSNMTAMDKQNNLAAFGDALMVGWDNGLKQLSADERLGDLMKKQGINSGKQLKDAVEGAGGVEEWIDSISESFAGAYGESIDTSLLTQISTTLENAGKSEAEVLDLLANHSSALGAALGDLDGDARKFFSNWFIQSEGMTLQTAQDSVKALAVELASNNNIFSRGFNPFPELATMDPKAKNALATARAEIEGMSEGQREELSIAVNTTALTQGLKQSDDLAQGLLNVLNAVPAPLDAAGRRAKTVADNLAQAGRAATIAKSVFSSIQSDIASDMRDSFDDRMNAAIESRQSYWDSRQSDLDNAMSRRSDAMDARHEAQQEGLDRKWERRTDRAEKYWDSRIKGVDNAIKAEQKAEELRKKMFDAEIARINKLNEMANRNIDFNIALSSGSLDEAAKIRNDAEAQNTQYALESAAEAGSAGSQKRVDSLENRKEGLEEAREVHMKRLEQRAADEKRAQARSQKREKAHLDKITKMRQASLKKQADADMAAQKANWEKRKESLEDQLELFLAYTAKSEKDLKRHMDRTGISYKEFGDKTLKPKGLEWAKYFNDKLQVQIKKATNEMRSDAMWARLGRKSTSEMIKGMGFPTRAAFNKFMRTGVLPSAPAAKPTKNQNPTDNGNKGGDTAGTTSDPKYRHEGGPVGGKGKDSRKGVARTQRGLHSSEQMILAQKGEYVVNRRDASRNLDTLQRINSGEEIGDTGLTHGSRKYGTGGYGGAPAMMQGILGHMMMKGVEQGYQNAYAKKQAQMAAAQVGTIFGSGRAGMYGDRSFTGEHLRNAAIIATAGSRIGMSARDIQIGIMTAIAESGLVNVKYGDRDSQGLFQQRPSMGWGTVEQVTTPDYAASTFFRRLKAHGERTKETPWLAAQHIQRSAFSDGSNYRAHWDSAQAIFKRGLSRTKSGGYSANTANYTQGAGGWSHPTRGRGSMNNGHDISVPVGTPVYAVGDGVIKRSRYITVGGSAGNGSIAPNGKPYRSYGETITLRAGGADINYAHLQRGSRIGAGTRVKGGTQIARSGNTGNSSGPHLHLDIGGYHVAKSFMGARGVSLRKGAEDIRFNNTIANLHKGEAVLTKDISAKFREGVDNFASGGNAEYNVHVNVGGSNASPDEIANKVIVKLGQLERRKPRSRRN